MVLKNKASGIQSTQTITPDPSESRVNRTAEDQSTEPQEIDSTKAEEIDKAFNKVDNALKEVDDVLLPLASGTPLGMWVPAIPGIAKLNEKLDPAKKVLISVIEAFDKLVDAAEALINLIEAFIGYLLEQASVILLLLKAAVQMLKQVLKQLRDAMKLSLLESGMYYGQFVFTWNDVYSRSDKYNVVANTGPLVYNTLTAAVTEWMNRPQAQDTMCGLMFMPFSIPPEAARTVSGALKLSELLEYHIDKLRKAVNENKRKTPYKDQVLMEASGKVLPRIAANMRTLLIQGTTFDERKVVASAVYNDINDHLQDAVDTVIADTADKLADLLDLQNQTAEERLLKAEKDPEFDDIVPGSMIFLGSKVEKGKAVLYSNYRNKTYRYISSIFKVSDGEVSEVFRDPSFAVASLMTNPEVRQYMEIITDIIRSYLKIKSSFRLDAERNAITGPFSSTLPGTIAALVKKNNIPDKVIPFIVLHALLTYPKISGQLKELTGTYEKQLKTVSLEYGRRSSVAYRRLYPDNLVMDSAKEGDIYYITFAPQDTLYFGSDFLKTTTPPGSVQTGRWLAGTPEAVGGTTTGIIKVRKDIDLYPMWYSAATPESVNSISSDRFLNDILPPAITNSVDDFYDLIDAAEESIDNALKSVNKTKEKVQDIKAEIMKYITVIRDISDSLKEFIENLELLKLPEMYIVTWKGNADSIPEIMINALMEKNILQSTYGGAMIFAEATALSALLDMYKAGRDAVNSSELIASDTAAYFDRLEKDGNGWSDVTARADVLVKKIDAVKTGFEAIPDVLDEDNLIILATPDDPASLDRAVQELHNRIKTSGYLYSRQTRITVTAPDTEKVLYRGTKHDGDLDE
ncbi:MAG: hypothetical protein WC279_11930 [Sulfurimonas sp.]|jgi:hypothetical protein|uniref:hypothetical protein n=1 Tax=Sulfurimonas sp. TaxID=2022749 RepID=UPI0035684B21